MVQECNKEFTLHRNRVIWKPMEELGAHNRGNAKLVGTNGKPLGFFFFPGVTHQQVETAFTNVTSECFQGEYTWDLLLSKQKDKFFFVMFHKSEAMFVRSNSVVRVAVLKVQNPMLVSTMYRRKDGARSAANRMLRYFGEYGFKLERDDTTDLAPYL